MFLNSKGGLICMATSNVKTPNEPYLQTSYPIIHFNLPSDEGDVTPAQQLVLSVQAVVLYNVVLDTSIE